MNEGPTRGHESLLLLSGPGFFQCAHSADIASEAMGTVWRVPPAQEELTPRHTRLEPRARYDDRNGWLNTETRWHSRCSAEGRHSQEHDKQGTEARNLRVESVRPTGSPRCRERVCVKSHTTRAPTQPTASIPRAPRASGHDGTTGQAVSGPGPHPGLGLAPLCHSPVIFQIERSVRRWAIFLLCKSSPNIADRFCGLKQNDAGRNQLRHRLIGTNSQVPMATQQSCSRKPLSIVNRTLQAA